MENKKGRKPITDKKVPVTIFVRQSTITQWGTIEALRAHLTSIALTKSQITTNDNQLLHTTII